jgi:hypothetical protein
MPNQSDPDTELTSEAAEVLKGILDETKDLRELELGDARPAGVYAAARR